MEQIFKEWEEFKARHQLGPQEPLQHHPYSPADEPPMHFWPILLIFGAFILYLVTQARP